MKRFLPVIFIFCQACVNQNSTDTISSSEPNVQDSVSKPEGSVKIYVPKKAEKQIAVSQKDVIMNEAVAISNEFYNSLKSGNYAGATVHMHADALSVTSVTEWNKIYQMAKQKKGQLGFVTMYDYGVKLNMKGGNGMGDYAEIIFDAQYKDGNMREKLTFFRKDSTEAVKILGYEFDERIDRVTIYKGLR